MPKLLWVGDAVAHTGFATVTHSVLDHLRHKWDVSVLGINYLGDPHPYPYQIFPAAAPCGGRSDQWGLSRVVDVANHIGADVVLVNNDPWNVANFVDVWRMVKVDIPLVAYMPVDAKDMDAPRTSYLNLDGDGRGLKSAIWYTEFARKEANSAGYYGESHVVPHGIDTDRFYPLSKLGCRRKILGDSYDDLFVVGNVNRNQFRKRLDTTFEYVADWIYRVHADDPGFPHKVLLYLHAEPNAPLEGWDLAAMQRRYHINTAWPQKDSFRGINPEDMRSVYGMLDVQVSTGMGEGWGLTTMEGLYCGVPQIVPDYAALGEWTSDIDGVTRVPIEGYLTYPQTGTRGATPERKSFVDALEASYQHPRRLKLDRRDEWEWANIADRFDGILNGVLAACCT